LNGRDASAASGRRPSADVVSRLTSRRAASNRGIHKQLREIEKMSPLQARCSATGYRGLVTP
jgi:hypothetical protein